MNDETFSTLPTKRESETLELIAKGFSNIQIGKLMNIQYTTVKTHLANLYLKFNMNYKSAARTSESSVLRLRLALKYLADKGYLDYERPKFKQLLIKILKCAELNQKDGQLFSNEWLIEKIKEVLNEK